MSPPSARDWKALITDLRLAARQGVRAGLLKAAALRVAERYLERSRKMGVLAPAVTELEREHSMAPDRSAAIEALLGGRLLECLDIGARGGPQVELTRYQRFFRFFLAEGEPAEAAKLRAEGHVVIDRLLSERAGTAPFHVTRIPSKSSILPPGGHMLGYFAAGRLEQFDVVQKLELPTTSIAAVAAEHGVHFDAVKLDTQGNELAILRGLGDERPLVLKTEVSMAELYRGQDLFYELGRHLYDLGYVMFRLDMITTPSPLTPGFTASGDRPSVGFPVHGDAFFMPDWTRPRGRELLVARDRAWAALALMFGQQQVVHHVLAEVPLPGADAIARALQTSAASSRAKSS